MNYLSGLFKNKDERLIYIGAISVRFILLIVLLLFLGENILVSFADSDWYTFTAQNLVSLHRLVIDPSHPELLDGYRTPGYPFFLAIFIFFGLPLWVAAAVQIVIVSFIPIIAMKIARLFVLEKSVERTAGILTAFEPIQVFYSVLVLSDALGAFAFLGSVYFLAKYWKEAGMKNLGFSAVFLALYNYIRRIGVYIGFGFVPFLIFAAMLLRRPWKKYVIPALLYCVVSFLILLPWFVRNYYVFDRFSISTMSGLYSAAAASTYAVVERIDTGEAQNLLMEKIKPFLPEQRDMTSPRNDIVYLKEAWKIISAHPKEYLKVYAFALNTFFTSANYHAILARLDLLPHPSGGVRSFTIIFSSSSFGESWRAASDFVKEPYGLVALLGRLIYGPVFLASLFGALILWRRGGDYRFLSLLYLFYLAYFSAFIAVMIEGTESRHRLQLNPLIFLMASTAVYYSYCILRKRLPFLD